MKTFLLIVISIIPVNRIRIFFYNTLFNYRISYNSSIGMFNIISTEECTIQNGRIGSFNYIHVKALHMSEDSVINKLNRLKSVKSLTLKKRAVINSKNFIGGPSYTIDTVKGPTGLELGEDSSILRSNYLDVSCGYISIGKNVVVGGHGTQFWTHGFDVRRNLITGNIILYDNIYIGTSCIFVQGIEICSNVSIGAGSVIHRSITESGFYASANLLKKGSLQVYQ